jgi:hypothetical protein
MEALVTSPETRCVVCGQPCTDHIPFRYWWAAYWRHRVFQVAGFILGRLPLGAAELD